MTWEQMASARKKLRPIMSKSHLLERSCVQSRATGTCSKEDASNHEQVADAHNEVAEKPIRNDECAVGAVYDRPHFIDSLKNGRSQSPLQSRDSNCFSNLIRHYREKRYASIWRSIRIIARTASITRRRNSSIRSAS